MITVKATLERMGIRNEDCVALHVPGSSENAYAIKVDGGNRHKAWETFNHQKAVLGFCPILCATWSGCGGAWKEAVIEEDVFSRFYFEEEGQERGHLPDQILSQVASASVEDLMKEHDRVYTDAVVDSISYHIEQLSRLFGKAPSEQDMLDAMASGQIAGYFDFNKWLLDWQVEHVGIEKMLDGVEERAEWFEPDTFQFEFLLLLPIFNSEDSLAYMHWFGACERSTPASIKMLEMWRKEYGAEIVSHYGTMLNIKAKKPPSNIDKAFELATQMEAMAPCTTVLAGITLTELAASLVGKNEWFLHERP